MNIVPNLDQRAVFVGMTGSGKTTLAEVIMRYSRNYQVVHDSKDRIFWPGYERHTTLDTLRNSRWPKLIYAPNHFELDDWDKAEQFFEWGFLRQHTTIYVDEVYAVTKRSVIPHYYMAGLTRGRQMNVQVLSGTQRPTQIPLFVLSESEHSYTFMLQLDDDRKRMEGITGISRDKLAALQLYQFYYARAGGVRSAKPLILNLNAAQPPATNHLTSPA